MDINRIEPGKRVSGAVVRGGTVYLAGQAGEGESVAEQCRSALAKVDHLLTTAGTDKTKILQTLVYLADVADFAEMNSVWEEWIDPVNPPARATSGATLAAPHYKVEFVVTAAV